MAKENKKPKVLIFEDDKDFAWLLRQMLDPQGFECKHYVSPPESEEELVNLVLLERPDIISTDLLHLGTDGYGIVKLLKEDERTKKVPIIVLTTFKEKEAKEKGLELGAVADRYYCKADHLITDLVKGYKELIIQTGKFTKESFILDSKVKPEAEGREGGETMWKKVKENWVIIIIGIGLFTLMALLFDYPPGWYDGF